MANVRTINVQANVHVLGLAPGEVGEVPDDEDTKALIENGMLERAGKVETTAAPEVG